ncbi:hypothetical protein [Lentibacillus salinarum]|uniref:Uncharacterized protein n=1 Tax=Lentibacillus salinarum TaxID=446820 RepID=A0ABW3ZR87_9BACI
MINVTLAKSKMIKEEGTNYLWIQIDTSFPFKIDVQLPKGINRKLNLNGYPEGDHGTIYVNNFQQNDVLIELFTEPGVTANEGTIILTVTKETAYSKTHIKAVPFKIANPEDPSDLVFTEPSFINRLKSLQEHN